jgi:DNA gyrase subunit A
LIATRNGLVKKTALTEYSRPRQGGVIGIKLEEGDSLIDVALVRGGDEVVLSTRRGMAIRFSEADARPMGRATMGVRGINLTGDDAVIGMVVADPDGQLLTVCENGYGKRTPFGPNTENVAAEVDGEAETNGEPEEPEAPADVADAEVPPGEEPPVPKSAMRYRRQRRGGKGVKDIRTSERNGPVVGVVPVRDADDVMLITMQGMVTRIKASEIRVTGRNTQGVRVITPNEGDKVASVAIVAREEVAEAAPKP